MKARVETVLPATVASPSVARRFAAAALRRWGIHEPTVETAQLLISEVVTNAVVHAGSQVRITVQRRGSRLRIEVSDLGDGVPFVTRAGGDDEFGRGMAIVEQVAHAWGWTPRTGGKAVWFELEV